jgi:Ca2+-binding RTX toxin-like protein
VPPEGRGRWERECASVLSMKRPILAALALAVAAAPATASAASIEVATPNGSQVIVYEAAPGEVNRVKMEGTVGGPFDFRMEFFEFSAPLVAGPGCIAGFPTICGDPEQAFPVDASLGDNRDVAYLNSLTQNLTLNAGAGSDDVFAGGIDANADGEGGNDIIRLAANNVTTGTGGSGNDKIAAGLGAAAATLDGGIGNDLVVGDAFAFNDLEGGSGSDDLVALQGFEVNLAGQSGRDVLVASGGGDVELSGGSGGDVIASQLGGVAVSAGSGHDVVDVFGGAATAADTVTCGTGWDLVWANAGDAVAGDCELVLKVNPPTLPSVADAQQAAEELLDHTPDPSAR